MLVLIKEIIDGFIIFGVVIWKFLKGKYCGNVYIFFLDRK